MSATYSVYCTLQATNTKKNIRAIIKRGAEIGCIYYNDIWKKHDSDSVTLSIENAVKVMMDRSPEVLVDFGPSIYTKFEDTYFVFRINPNFDNNLLNVSMGAISHPWRKEFWNSPEDVLMIDFARYIRLMLKLCDDFTILKLKTIAD